MGPPKKKPVVKKTPVKVKSSTKKTLAKETSQAPEVNVKALKRKVPTKMNEGELESEDAQDILTEEDELLLAEQEKKRAQRKKKIAKLEKKMSNSLCKTTF